MSLLFVATSRDRVNLGGERGIPQGPLPGATPADATALALDQLPLFSSLSPMRAAELARACSVRVFRRGEFIVEQGGHDHALFVLLSGRALTLRTDNQGREVFLTLMASGALVGELSLVDGLGHSSTARCESTCHVLVIPAPAIAAELAQNPGLAEALLKLLTHRLRHAHQRVSSLALDTVRERLVRQLWLMSVDQAGKRVVPHRVSRQMLANMLGASREMVSRVMAELAEEGMIGSLPDGMIWLHAAPL